MIQIFKNLPPNISRVDILNWIDPETLILLNQVDDVLSTISEV